jgi:hypothetical protein
MQTEKGGKKDAKIMIKLFDKVLVIRKSIFKFKSETLQGKPGHIP